jgi:glycosyltransferase involved in cell wall biosynthesis
VTTRSGSTVEIVLPVFNEALQLEQNVVTLIDYLKHQAQFQWRITIANNASTDDTAAIAFKLAERFPELVFVEDLSEKGRGRALRQAWLKSTADVVAYMDIDLSTNLRHFVPMVNPLLAGEFGIATGSRLLPGAQVERQLKREIISRSYNLLVKVLFPQRKFVDAQCGFKALTREAVQELIPLIEDQSWFFDTELLLRAEQSGYIVHEVPVQWVEDLESSVKILKTAFDDVVGLVRVRRESLSRATSRRQLR